MCRSQYPTKKQTMSVTFLNLIPQGTSLNKENYRGKASLEQTFCCKFCLTNYQIHSCKNQSLQLAAANNHWKLTCTKWNQQETMTSTYSDMARFPSFHDASALWMACSWLQNRFHWHTYTHKKMPQILYLAYRQAYTPAQTMFWSSDHIKNTDL